MQLAFVAGVRALVRIAARWQTTPTAADQQLVRRAGFAFSAGLTAAACSWTVALAAASDGASPSYAAACIAGSVVMVLAAILAWVSTTGRLAPPTGDTKPIPYGSTLGAAERALNWLSRWPRTWCATVAILAALTAMPHAETTASGELAWGAIQGAAVVVGFIFLGPALGLRRRGGEI
jgi:hypothetical protein